MGQDGNFPAQFSSGEAYRHHTLQIVDFGTAPGGVREEEAASSQSAQPRAHDFVKIMF